MKKRLFVLSAIAVLLAGLSSCLRSDDWELLKHPIHVQGQIEPNMGAPIAHGTVTINDVLHMFNNTYTGMIDPDEDILTIDFESNRSDSILAKSIAGSGTKSPFLSKDTLITYGVDITLFDKVTLQDIVNGNININHLWLTFNAEIWGDCPDTVRHLVQRYVHAYYDSLTVKYTDYNYQEHIFNGIPLTSMSFDNVLTHETLDFDSVDLAEIVNSMPRHVQVSFRFRFELDNSIFNEDLAELYFNQLLDSIWLTKIYYNTHVRVAFPFEIEIDNLPYAFDVDLGDGLSQVDIDAILDSIGEGLEVDLKDSYLTLGFDNGIPLDLTIAATLIDDHGLPIGGPRFTETIKSAPTVPLPSDPSAYESSGTTHSQVKIHADANFLRDLRRSKKIRFNLIMATCDKHVTIKHSDFLDIKVYLQLHPSASIDIPVTDNGLLK